TGFGVTKIVSPRQSSSRISLGEFLLEETGLRDQKTVDTLYSAATIVPGYLEYDEAKALAVKAIWALGKIENEAAEAKLGVLARSEHPIIRDEAINQPRRRGVKFGEANDGKH
ncbi:MAG TPA: HEAT repeat domain-containing protein, partial [Candidatus Acidoferrum sp.]